MNSPISRRDLLTHTGTGLGLLGLALLSEQQQGRAAVNPLAPKKPHFAPKAKAVIHLFMNGGPSQVDTFDPKPALEKHNGKKPSAAGLKTERNTGGLMMSPFKFARHGQSGLEVSDLFPEVARHADKLCVIRSMHTNVPNHEPSLLMMTSGETQPTRPSMGSWLLYGLGAENQNLPGFVVLCPGKPVVGPQLWGSSFLPGIFQGAHISASKIDPRTAIPHLGNPGMTLQEQREQLDLLRRMNEAHLARRGGRDNALEARIQSLEMAFRMQAEARDAFDLAREPRRVREAYGSGYFADTCLLARRLVERGVRMVQIYTGAGQPWDDHGNILDHRNKAKQVDRPIAALLSDLQARGLLGETLVLWGGEFGRTPTSEGARGRDHNNHGFSVWLAGGGVKGGTVVGASDEFGFAAVENKVHVHDLHATMLHLLGIDHEKLTYRYGGRDFRLTDVSGRIVREVLA
jgi:hypothetical protein